MLKSKTFGTRVTNFILWNYNYHAYESLVRGKEKYQATKWTIRSLALPCIALKLVLKCKSVGITYCMEWERFVSVGKPCNLCQIQSYTYTHALAVTYQALVLVNLAALMPLPIPQCLCEAFVLVHDIWNSRSVLKRPTIVATIAHEHTQTQTRTLMCRFVCETTRMYIGFLETSLHGYLFSMFSSEYIHTVINWSEEHASKRCFSLCEKKTNWNFIFVFRNKATF